MKWHLHVTVKPHWSWTLSDVSSALTRDIEQHGIKPLVITNHFDVNPIRDYRELIPSKEIEADDEATPSREIFRMGVLLNNAGWRVKRLKIEGDARHESVRNRALYFETHLKNLHLPPHTPPKLPRSTTAKGNTFHTIRRCTPQKIHDFIEQAMVIIPRYEIEAAVLDTAPHMDQNWISQ